MAGKVRIENAGGYQPPADAATNPFVKRALADRRKMKGKPPQKVRPGWMLYFDLFEVHWKRGRDGQLYADRVRVMGTTFWYRGKK